MPNEQKENNNVVIENAEMRLIISNDGKARSLIHKATGEECLITNADVPLCAITQYRPYDNENFLMFPAKPRTFPANKIERTENELRIEFQVPRTLPHRVKYHRLLYRFHSEAN